MSHTILVFVNVSRQDAFIYFNTSEGNTLLAGKLAAGESARQIARAGEKWSVTAGDTYTLTVGDQNRVYLIGSGGVYEVDKPRALTPDGGGATNDFDFPSFGGGPWP
ncbi:MAG: hypothetical protein DCC52_06865 [Chloroflexi bacterium]|nr:MAG: hypothetical protein DCC52_06865 [Chloroflexota bacterium]